MAVDDRRFDSSSSKYCGAGEASIGFDDTKAMDGTSFTDSQCVLADDAALM
jgi:hypothetical protein